MSWQVSNDFPLLEGVFQSRDPHICCFKVVFQTIKIKAGLLENLELYLYRAKDSMKFI